MASGEERTREEMAFVLPLRPSSLPPALPHSLETFLVLSDVLFGPSGKEREPENEASGPRAREGDCTFCFMATCDGDS